MRQHHQARQETLEEFYDDLQRSLDRGKTQFNIIVGDFNVKLGVGNESCLGKFTHEARNERGEDLINFSLTNNLKIVNTLFIKKANQR